MRAPAPACLAVACYPNKSSAVQPRAAKTWNPGRCGEVFALRPVWFSGTLPRDGLKVLRKHEFTRLPLVHREEFREARGFLARDERGHGAIQRLQSRIHSTMARAAPEVGS